MGSINSFNIKWAKFLILGAMVFSVTPGAYCAQENNFKALNLKESKPQKIKNIELVGNQLIDNERILQNFQVKPGDIYDKDQIQENLKHIFEMGYFSDKMKVVPVKTETGEVTLKILVEENIPVTGFTIQGNTAVPTGELLQILQPLEDKPQNINTLNDSISDIEALYTAKGYILARVVAVKDDPDGVVNIVISEGTINSVRFDGNTKTKDFVVQRNIRSVPGSIYNDNTIKEDLMRIYGTQAFKNVDRTIERCEDPNYYNITINLEEQKTGTVSLGGGLDTATGLFGQVGYTENNFRGMGQRVSLNLMSGTGVILSDSSMLRRANYQAELSFFEPKLKGTDNSLLLKVFGRDFSSYQVPLAIEQRIGAEAVVSRDFKQYKNLSGSFKLGVEYINMREGDYNEIANLYRQHNIPIGKRAEQLKGGTFLTLGPSLIYDTRDSASNPRDGVFATLRLNGNIGITDLDLSHSTATAGIKRYIPVMKKSALAFSARGGGKIAGDMPEVMAFRLGGPYSVRGYKMSGIGTGEGFVMGSVELTTPFFFLDRIKQVPFLDNVKFATFLDAGKIYNGSITNKIYNRPESGVAAGIGIRLSIPGVGPLSIDYGVPFTSVGEGNSKGAITFGVGDYY